MNGNANPPPVASTPHFRLPFESVSIVSQLMRLVTERAVVVAFVANKLLAVNAVVDA